MLIASLSKVERKMLVDPKQADEASRDQDTEIAALHEREAKRLMARDQVMSVLEPAEPALLGSLGFLLFIAIWQAIHSAIVEIPSPGFTFNAALDLFSHPFYSNGPNDQGIGWNILSSLRRVALGFGFAAIVGIPMGFAIGRFKVFGAMTSPIISLL